MFAAARRAASISRSARSPKAFAGAALSPLAPDDYPPAARTKVDALFRRCLQDQELRKKYGAQLKAAPKGKKRNAARKSKQDWLNETVEGWDTKHEVTEGFEEGEDEESAYKPFGKMVQDDGVRFPMRSSGVNQVSQMCDLCTRPELTSTGGGPFVCAEEQIVSSTLHARGIDVGV